MPKHEIVTMMVLSTAHVSATTAKLLDDLTLESAFRRDDGWIFYVGNGPTDAPVDLEAVLAYARRLGCVWVMLDSDGPIMSDLPNYGTLGKLRLASSAV